MVSFSTKAYLNFLHFNFISFFRAFYFSVKYNKIVSKFPGQQIKSKNFDQILKRAFLKNQLGFFYYIITFSLDLKLGKEIVVDQK